MPADGNRTARAPAAPSAAPVESWLEAAVTAHQAKRFEEAAAGYRRVLAAVPDHLEAHINLGNALRHLGRLDEAIATYTKAAATHPDNAQLSFNLGNALGAAGRLEAAVEAYRNALSRRPDLAAARFNLGNALRDLGRLDEAVDAYRAALHHLPRLARLHGNLGNVLKTLGHLEEAEASHRRALALEPGHAPGHYNLGNTLSAQSRFAEAAEAFRRSIALDPDFAEAHLNLANALVAAGEADAAEAASERALALAPDLQAAHMARGRQRLARERWADAETAFRDALERWPDDADLHFLLARALHGARNFAAAVRHYHEALSRNPDLARAPLAMALHGLGAYEEAIAILEDVRSGNPEDADIHSNLGVLYHLVGRIDEAEAALREAIRLQPEFPTALSNLAYTLIVKSALGEAVACCERALAIRPDYTEALSNLGYALGNQGRLDEASAAFRQALDCDPGYYKAQSNLLFLMNYSARNTPEAVAAEHRAWGEKASAAVSVPGSRDLDREPERRLRIGYVSPDFRRHSVAYFFEALLAEHDPEAVETVCYAHVPAPDAMTERLRGLAHEWHDIATLDDPALADKIRGERIDILVDLAGHTAKNRLPAFVHKPAPVQVTYLGYPNTSGLARIDYRLTDAVADPPDDGDDLYAERLVRLDRCFLAYRPPQAAPAVSRLPSERIGRITFGSFNNNTKITPEVIAVWSRILRKLPTSRLLLKSGPFADRETRQRYLDMFAAEGVDPKRIRAFGYLPEVSDHLNFYANIDLALDTFPYNGTTTTCEALWMGVPVLTLAGRVHASRVGASLLTAVGIEDLIARDTDDYVGKAIALASDPVRLADLRGRLRPAMAASPLTDGAGLARAIEDAYRRMWREWCEQS